MSLEALPALNALLNATAASLLVAGYHAIRVRRDERRHKACMIAATAVSAAFLVSYLVYHWQVGSRRYPGEGWDRTVYLSILLVHTLLAAANVPLVAATIVLAARGRRRAHRRWARRTLPVWLTVSVTGVVVYLMVYRPWTAL